MTGVYPRFTVTRFASSCVFPAIAPGLPYDCEPPFIGKAIDAFVLAPTALATVVFTAPPATAIGVRKSASSELTLYWGV